MSLYERLGEPAAGHAGPDIPPRAFDRIVGHLVATLTDPGASVDDVVTVSQPAA